MKKFKFLKEAASDAIFFLLLVAYDLIFKIKPTTFANSCIGFVVALLISKFLKDNIKWLRDDK